MSSQLTVAEIKEAVANIDPTMAEFIGPHGEGLIDVCQAVAVKLWLCLACENNSTETIRRAIREYRNGQ